MKQTISIIIAAFNEERHIAHCLESLLNQSKPAHEIIVVDDGSTDNTWQILQVFKKKHQLVKIYRKKHVEQATARNFGFSKSIGNILVFPDADYYFDQRFIQKLVAPIIKQQAIATYTKEEYIANPDNVWSICWNISRLLPPGQRVLADTPNRANNFRAIRRKEFAKAGGFSETGYSNDITVLNKLGLPTAGMAAAGAICYHYNPDTLAKVFTASKRLGSKGGIPLKLTSFLIYSFPNSILKGLMQLRNNNFAYILFKIIFDFGVTLGLIERFFATVVRRDINAIRAGNDR